MTSRARWHDMWTQLGASSSNDELYLRLVACYAESQRKYHTMQHLAECFAHLALLHDEATRPLEIELALWFHDAIYKARRKDNEAQSADWARATVLSNGLSPDCADRIHGLVLMTKHDAVPAEPDARVMVDVDLGILGADPERFDEYEQQVRQEYAWVPGLLYRRERRKVLQQFAARAQIYSTEHFHRAREAVARANIARSLARL